MIPKTPTQINPNCTACQLYATASTVCLKGKGIESKKRLAIFTDYPDYFADKMHTPYAQDTGKLLNWLLLRMSVDPDDVAFEYTLRCYPKRDLPSTKAGRSSCIEECSQYRFATIAKIRPRAIVALGQVSLEAFTGKTKVGDYQGRQVQCWEGVVRDYCQKVWIGYSIAYLLMSPSDTPSVFRVIFHAAEAAGLKPKLDPTVKPFHWNTF